MAIGISKTFPMDLDLISRLMQYYQEYPHAIPDVIGQAVGLNKPKVDGLNALMGHLGLQEKRALTPIGRLIVENDKYLKDVGTLCVLHYLLSTNINAEVWFYAANHFIPENAQFTREEFTQALDNANIGQGNTRLKADRSLFLNAYTSNDYRSLQTLGYIRKIGDKDEVYKVYPVEHIPALVLGFALYHQRVIEAHTQHTISISSLLSLDGQIGKIFVLRRELLLEKLRQLESRSLLGISQIADLDNITYTNIDNPLSLLMKYYQER